MDVHSPHSAHDLLLVLSTIEKVRGSERHDYADQQGDITWCPTAKSAQRRPRPNTTYADVGIAPWDITKLHGPAKWSYYHLYVIIDIYSRYVVVWLIAGTESKVLAEQLLADTVAKQDIDRAQLTIHADNGSSMASKPVAFLVSPSSTVELVVGERAESAHSPIHSDEKCCAASAVQ
jgi:transposase InsO family protein